MNIDPYITGPRVLIMGVTVAAAPAAYHVAGWIIFLLGVSL